MTNSSIEQTLPWWRRLVSFLVQFILFVAVATLFTIILSLILELTPLSDASTTLGTLFYEWTIPLIATLSTIYLLDRWQWRKGMHAYGFSKSNIGKSLLIGVLVSFVILFACFGILLLGGWASVSSIDIQGTLILSWLLLFLIQPLTEEVVIRSFLQTQLHRHFGQQAGLLVAAFIFALIHSANDHMTWLAGLQIFAGGYLMGILFLHTRNIWAAFAMHASWNFVQSVVLGFAVSGLDTYHVLETTTNGPDWLTGGAFGIEGSVLSLLFIILGIIYFQKQQSQALEEVK